jgi:hypothetical protein
LLLAACRFEVSSSVHSGTVKDANVEEPLTEGARKYERALEVSNQVLDRIAARDYERIYRENLDPSFRAQLDHETFTRMMQQLESNAGPILTYKRMQWAFDRGSDQGIDLLASTKIVRHQKGWLTYRFVFRDDGNYASLVGLHYASPKK